MSEAYGWIGLGAMGLPMAANLRKSLPESVPLHIYDVSTAVLGAFAAEHSNVVVCSSSKEVTEKSSVILSIVPEGKHVKAVFLSDDGACAATGGIKGKLFIDCSTIDVATSKEVAAQVEGLGAKFFDAPVSGGPAGAKAGTLTVMLGISEDDALVEKVKDVTGKMGGKNLFACGGPSLGLVTKTCNNYCSGTIAIATAETMNMAVRSGLDPHLLSSILKVSTGGSWVNANCNPCPGVSPNAPPSHDYQGGFAVQLMRKDYALAVEMAKAVDAKLMLGEAGLKTYEGAAADPRCVGRDSRVVYRFIDGVEKY